MITPYFLSALAAETGNKAESIVLSPDHLTFDLHGLCKHSISFITKMSCIKQKNIYVCHSQDHSIVIDIWVSVVLGFVTLYKGL